MQSRGRHIAGGSGESGMRIAKSSHHTEGAYPTRESRIFLADQSDLTFDQNKHDRERLESQGNRRIVTSEGNLLPLSDNLFIVDMEQETSQEQSIHRGTPVNRHPSIALPDPGVSVIHGAKTIGSNSSKATPTRLMSLINGLQMVKNGHSQKSATRHSNNKKTKPIETPVTLKIHVKSSRSPSDSRSIDIKEGSCSVEAETQIKSRKVHFAGISPPKNTQAFSPHKERKVFTTGEKQRVNSHGNLRPVNHFRAASELPASSLLVNPAWVTFKPVDRKKRPFIMARNTIIIDSSTSKEQKKENQGYLSSQHQWSNPKNPSHSILRTVPQRASSFYDFQGTQLQRTERTTERKESNSNESTQQAGSSQSRYIDQVNSSMKLLLRLTEALEKSTERRARHETGLGRSADRFEAEGGRVQPRLGAHYLKIPGHRGAQEPPELLNNMRNRVIGNSNSRYLERARLRQGVTNRVGETPSFMEKIKLIK